MTLDEQLTIDLWILDALLTGKDPRSGRGNEDKLVTCEKFFNGELFYLSDGGYSRVRYNEMDAIVTLTSESSDCVKDKWGFLPVITVRFRIERRIREWLAE